MAYPSQMLWGAGACRFYLSGGGLADPATVTLDTTVSAMLEFEPEREDGGAIKVRLSNGKWLIRQPHKFRPTITITGIGLTDVLVAPIINILNFSARGGKLIRQPHIDTAHKFEVVPDDSIPLTHTGELYLAHDFTLVFNGVNLIDQLPLSVGTGTELSNALSLFNAVG